MTFQKQLSPESRTKTSCFCKHVVLESYFGNIVNKAIYGNIVNMMLKINEHPIYNTSPLQGKERFM